MPPCTMQLTGTIPPEISRKTTLQEFKVEHNYVSGSEEEWCGAICEHQRTVLPYTSVQCYTQAYRVSYRGSRMAG